MKKAGIFWITAGLVLLASGSLYAQQAGPGLYGSGALRGEMDLYDIVGWITRNRRNSA